MIPAWHKRIFMYGHAKESETAKGMQLHALHKFQIQPIVPQLNYYNICLQRENALKLVETGSELVQ